MGKGEIFSEESDICGNQSPTVAKRSKKSKQDSSTEQDTLSSKQKTSSNKKTGTTSKQKFEIGQSVLGFSEKYNQLFDAKVEYTAILLLSANEV